MATDIIARTLAIRALKGLSNGVFAGYVTAGSGFPLTRPDGSELKNEDYARPKASDLPFDAVDPATGETIHFENKSAKVIYFNNSWLLDPGSLQDTSETPVKNYETESISGTDTIKNQKNINDENAAVLRQLRYDHSFDIICRASKPDGEPHLWTITYGFRQQNPLVDVITKVELHRGLTVIATKEGEDITSQSNLTFTYTVNDSDLPVTKQIYQTFIYLKPNRLLSSKQIALPVRFGQSERILEPGAIPATAWDEYSFVDGNDLTHQYDIEYGRAVIEYPSSLPRFSSILASVDDNDYENYKDSFEVVTPELEMGMRTYVMKEPCALKSYRFKFIFDTSSK